MMDKKWVRNIRDALDLHEERAQKWGIYVGIGILAILSICVRISLVRYNNGDYQAFASWYDFVKAHGLHGFKYAFSNYNPPYTYFLYILTLLPVPKMDAIKWLLMFFDVFMAAGVYLLVREFRPSRYIPLLAAIAMLFVPTVWITGVMWGQFDQLYVGAALFSLYFALRDNSRWSWIWMGIALSVKLQAVFFLPIFGLLVFKRVRWQDIIWGIGSFLLLTLPPVFMGRPLHSLWSIYPDESKLFYGYLTINTPNLYQWFSNGLYTVMNSAGIYIALAVSILIVVVGLVNKKFSKRDILVATTLLTYAIPFFLPAMHERYIFPAGIMSIVLAFVYPTPLLVGSAVAMQVVTILSYAPFLVGVTIVPFTLLAMVVLVIMGVLAAEYLRPTSKAKA